MSWSDMEAQFQDAMRSASMTTRARVKTRGGSVDVDLTRFDMPDTRRYDGAVLSRDYEIEYVHTDLPNLAEGDTLKLLDEDDVPIAKENYRVREAPTVTDNPADSRTGFFRRALLTKVG